MKKDKNLTPEEQEQVLNGIEKLPNELKYMAVFHVGLPSDLESVANDNIRREISNEFLLTLERLKPKYPQLTLDYNFGWMFRYPKKVSLD